MANLNQSSPELWAEKDVSNYINTPTPPITTKSSYSKQFTPEDTNYLHQLASLSPTELIAKVKELHDIAYQLGLEEAKEVKRGRYLNLLKGPKKPK